MKLQRLPTNAPSGTSVILVNDYGEPEFTRTRSEPWRIGGDGVHGRHVVLVDGRSGGYDVEMIFPLPIEVAVSEEPK